MMVSRWFGSLRSGCPGRWENALAIATYIAFAIGAISVVCWMLAYADTGFDFTDESYRLNWIAHPAIYSASATQFGFLYHPVYLLLGSDIVLLRQFNILLLYTLAMLFVYLVLTRRTNTTGIAQVEWKELILSAVLACAVFYRFTHWILTPGYNSLALCSLFLVAIALLLIVHCNKSNLFGWLLLAFGGWIAFMAKPPTAGVLFLISLLLILASRRFHFRNSVMAAGFLVGLFIASALLIDGSLEAFVNRVLAGSEHSRTLNGEQSLYDFLSPGEMELSKREKWGMAFVTIFMIVQLSLSLSAATVKRVASNLASFSLVLIALSMLWGLLPYEYSASRLQVLQLLGIPLAAFVVVSFFLAKYYIEPGQKTDLLYCVSLLMFPYAYAIGSNNNGWVQASSAGLFWVMAAVAVLALYVHPKPAARLGFGVGALVLLTAVLFVSASMMKPYRQPGPLSANSYELEIGGGRVQVADRVGEYILELRELARLAGFEKGTPVIDMSGHYPGSLFALNARPLGSAWLLGGYPGSLQFAYLGLASHSCAEIVSAWVLDEPEGPLRISPLLLERFGINLEKDFVIVGRLDSPSGPYPGIYEHVLYKPLRSAEEAIAACQQVKPEAGDKIGNSGS